MLHNHGANWATLLLPRGPTSLRRRTRSDTRIPLMGFTPRNVGRIEKRIPIALVVHLTQPQAEPSKGAE